MSAPKHRSAQPRRILAARAAELHAEGLNGLQIAKALQISKTYAYELLSDPTGELTRARKERYCGTCEECGARTSYTNDGSTSERCAECHDARYAERNERIFEAWDKGDTAPLIAAREGMTPEAVSTLVDNYRRRYDMPLGLHRVPNRTHWEHIQRRWNEDGATLRQIADELGYDFPSNVSQQITVMRRAGWHVEPRSARYDETTIQHALSMVRTGRSMHGVARELGIHQSTVWKWVRRTHADEAVAA
jgi:predicted transcriptional regulator